MDMTFWTKEEVSAVVTVIPFLLIYVPWYPIDKSIWHFYIYLYYAKVKEEF